MLATCGFLISVHDLKRGVQRNEAASCVSMCGPCMSARAASHEMLPRPRRDFLDARAALDLQRYFCWGLSLQNISIHLPCGWHSVGNPTCCLGVAQNDELAYFLICRYFTLATLHPCHLMPEGRIATVDGQTYRALKPWETIICWYLQGNRTIPGFLRWCEMDFATIHSMLRCQLCAMCFGGGRPRDPTTRCEWHGQSWPGPSDAGLGPLVSAQGKEEFETRLRTNGFVYWSYVSKLRIPANPTVCNIFTHLYPPNG